MRLDEKNVPLCILFLITTPKLSETAGAMFQDGNVLIQYQWTASGTASSEMMDILGCGTPDKKILISVLPKPFADNMLDKLKKASVIGVRNSGIAFTLPMSGVNSLILRILKNVAGNKLQGKDGKEAQFTMKDMKYVLIAAIVNQGYSENVMAAARSAGAKGGTVVSCRRTGNQSALTFWGLSIQEEKEMIFIIAQKSKKLKIMQAIGKECGVHSEAKGIVVSLPIDTVINSEED